mgnify:CR=1 FL=1
MEYKKGERVKHPLKKDWGLGEVISDSNREFISVFFIDAGEKKLALKYVQLIKVTGAESDNKILDKLTSETSDQYRIGKAPNSSASHNIKTWQIIESKMATLESASFEQLKIWCRSHDFSGGGEGFVKYCIKHGWLVSTRKK